MEKLDDADRLWPAIIVGAGPAGLATSYELGRRGIAHLVLERGDRPGAVWAGLYDSLTLHTGRHLSHLPGLKLPPGTPLFPSRAVFATYLLAYAETFALPLRTGCDLRRVSREEDGWRLETSCGVFRARTLVLATGIVSNPVLPEIAGAGQYRGRLLHARDYHRPGDVPEGRVLVIGAGNSGGEIASELAATGRPVDIAVRSGANVVPLTLAGVPIQYFAVVLRRLPRPLQRAIVAGVGKLVERRRGPSPLPPGKAGVLDAIPLIGFHLIDAINGGSVTVRRGLDRLVEDGAVFTDGGSETYPAILFATGYRPALNPLGELIGRDAKGFARRRDRVASADWPDLFFVGHNYDATGGLKNIAEDAGRAAAAVRRRLG